MFNWIILPSQLLAAQPVIDFVDGSELADLQQELQIELEWVHPNTADEALAYPKSALTDADRKRLQASPLVEVLEDSIEVQAFGGVNDPLYEKQWNLHLIEAEIGWATNPQKEVTVAVIDTGVTAVPDFHNETILPGISFVKGEKTSADLNGHGTHVAGTIAQYTNNKFGVASIAPHAKILPIKVLSKRGFGRSEWVAAGIDEAVDRGAQVLNLSLGGSPSKIIENAVVKALKSGVIVVAAAGNSGREGVASPATVPGVIAVSATDPKDLLSPYSSWGKEVSIAAPGGDKSQPGGGIIQDTIDGTDHAFKEFQGTSMATPHVAATAALLLSLEAGKPENIKELIYKGAKDIGTPGRDPKYGHGRLDIGRTIKLVAAERGLRFAGAGTLMLTMSILAGFRFRWLLAVSSAFFAGGAFFLPVIGVHEPLYLQPILNWLPISGWLSVAWKSALIPTLVIVGSIPFPRLRWLGVNVGIVWSTFFLAGLIDQQLDTSPIHGTWWLWLNLFLSVSTTLILVSLHRTVGDDDGKIPR